MVYSARWRMGQIIWFCLTLTQDIRQRTDLDIRNIWDWCQAVLLTLHKKEVFGQLNPLEKCFKIWYVYGKRKPTWFFSFFISSNFHFTLINARVYVDIDQGIHKGKMKVARNEKRKKLCGFSFSINIPNFEEFL